MSNLSIKDVPEAWAEALRQRALRNHRSLQGELLAMVEAVVQDETTALNATVAGASLSTPGRTRGHKTVEEIAIDMNLRFPELLNQGPRAVDIIRAERDAR